MVLFDKSGTCAAIQEIAATVSSTDLKKGLRYINKKGTDKAMETWASRIVWGCLAAPGLISEPSKPSPAAWNSNGVRTLMIPPKDDLIEGCIGKEKMKLIGQGYFGSVYAMKKNGKLLAVKVETLKDDRVVDYKPFLEMVEATCAAGKIGVGPKVHDYYMCLQNGRHHFVMIMDYIRGPTWDDWANFTTPAEMERGKVILKEKIASLRSAGIIHNDLRNPKNIIVVLKKGVLHTVVPVDYGISYFTEKSNKDERQFESMSQMFQDNWMRAFAGHLLRTELLQIK